MNDEPAAPQGPTQLAERDPLSLLRLAVEKGAGADELEKLAALAERLEANRARAAFAVALNACQGELTAIIRDDYNAHTKSGYVKLETLQAHIRPVYTRHGFSISWSQGEAREGLTRVVGRLYHIAGHSEQYQGDYPLDGVGAKGGSVMNPLQGTVSAHTYAQRDMLRLMFNLTIVDKDHDGNPVDPICTGDQFKVINDAIAEFETLGPPLDTKRFWAIYGVEGLHALPQSRFTQCVGELARITRERRKKVSK
jgi:hypothetical protein